MSVHLSVSAVQILKLTHQGAASNKARVCFSPSGQRLIHSYYLVLCHIFLIFSHHMLHPGSSIPPLLIFLLFREWSLLSALVLSVSVYQLSRIPLTIHKHTHTLTQPFYGSLDFVWDNPGEPVPKKHSPLTPIVVINRPLSASSI